MFEQEKSSNNNKLSEQQTQILKDVGFSCIPNSDEFQKIKVKPQNRWFNSIMALIVVGIGTCIGVTIGMIIYHFA